MNTKEMVVSIITSMMVIAMLASTATAIIVDGDESDWIGLAGVKSIEDPAYDIYVTPPAPAPGYPINWPSGYELTKFAIYYNASTDTLYFKFNTTGVPGDTDGDGDPNGCTNYSRAISDAFEVSVGNFMVLLDVTGDGKEDYRVIYTQDSIFVKSDGTVNHTANFTTEHSIGPPYENAVVEVSIWPAHNLTGFGDCDKSINVTQARCGSANDYCSEDSTCYLVVNEPPVPVPNGTNVCLCTNTPFDGSASYDLDGEIVSWKWDFGDGEAGSGVTTSHHYGNTGTYNVTLTVKDDFGINCSATITVVVYENPIANFTATEVEYCTNTSFTNTTTGGTQPYTYAWDFGDGNKSTEQNPTHHYGAPGTYNVTLNVTDKYGCTDGICKDVRVIPPPNKPPVAIPNGTNVCYCTYTEFDGSASYDPDGTIVSYEWDFGDGHTGSGETTSHHYDAPNGRTYNVTLTVTDNDGARNSSTITVDVYENPTVVASASEYVVAHGTGVTFSGTVSGGTPPYTCTWTIGETIYSGCGPHTVTINKLTIATLDVVDAHNCPGNDSVTVRIKHPSGAAVPVMSPFGIATLVGLLGLIGAGMIRKRR